MPKPKYYEDIKYWMEYVAYDLKCARVELDNDLIAAACFDCHQVVEKALKSMLLYYEVNIGKEYRIHNLIRLLEKVIEFDSTFMAFQKAVNYLSKFYIPPRYPGDWPGPESLYSEKDARKALKYAQEVASLVRKKIT